MKNIHHHCLFYGQNLHLYGDGTIFMPDENLLIVSDLHLEKGAALSTGAPLPQFDTLDTLNRLERAVNRNNVAQILCLGDSFHNISRAFQLPAPYLERLHRLGARAEFIWITGNHDSALPARLPGTQKEEYFINGIRLCHEADNRPLTPTISGHFHPKARVKLRARHLSAPCFVEADLNLIMPAFGSYTGGLNIISDAFRPFLTKNAKIHLCHEDKIYSLPFKKAHFVKAI